MYEKFNEEWTVEVIGKLHKYRIPHSELADACGYTPAYLSTVLNGHKKFLSDYSKDRTKAHIIDELNKLEAEILKEHGYEY